MSGKLIIFAAPSGAGKTTLVKYLLETEKRLEFSISACSRNARAGEINGKDYHFLGTDGFKAKIEENAFIEWEEVYKDNFYGTLKSEIDRIWKKGNTAVFDVDVEGALNLKNQFGDIALTVFVMPPSVEELEKRLIGRNTETEDTLKHRLAKAEREIAYADEFDSVIVNDNLELAKAASLKVVQDFLND